MGNTADLAMVQKTIINTPHKESKSQRALLKGGGCSRSAVSKHSKCKVTGRNKLGRKMCTSNRDDRKLRILSSKADSNTWESFTRSELKLESVHQESPRSDIFRKRYQTTSEPETIVRSILPGIRTKTTGLFLSGPKSSFQMKVNFAFNL